ncbi:MAG TPA: phosphodiester glycosidase family protein [Pyrinomonadaceae bacterium]
MKIRNVWLGKGILLTIFICFSHAVIHAQNWQTVRDGVEYAEVTRTIENQPVRMNLLRLDLKKVRLDVVHANDGAIGVETVSSIAARKGALAAINAGFFRLDTSAYAGDPAGIFQVDGKLLSEANNGRIALLIDNSIATCQKCKNPGMRTDVTIAHLKSWGELWSETRRSNIYGIDRQLKDNELILYTPEFGPVTPPSDSSLTEVTIDAGKHITSVSETSGGTTIPKGGYVLAASGARRTELSATAIMGKEGLVILGSYIENPDMPTTTGKMAFTSVEDIVGGVPQLIKNGKADVTWELEKTTKSFVETHHPRTAVAKLKDGKFLLITVDGRSEASGGISLYDLAAYLVELGATDAMNLDGGGSTTMYLNGKVVNHPSDKEGERKVSDALIVTPRKK